MNSLFNKYSLFLLYFDLFAHAPKKPRRWWHRFVLHAEGWVFKSQTRQTYVVKTGIDISTAKRPATFASVIGLRR